MQNQKKPNPTNNLQMCILFKIEYEVTLNCT